MGEVDQNVEARGIARGYGERGRRLLDVVRGDLGDRIRGRVEREPRADAAQGRADVPGLGELGTGQSVRIDRVADNEDTKGPMGREDRGRCNDGREGADDRRDDFHRP